jgi:hypothetical protein
MASLWGDEEEGGNSNVLPQPSETGPDANGIKTVITYHFDANKRKVRVTKKLKVQKQDLMNYFYIKMIKVML